MQLSRHSICSHADCSPHLQPYPAEPAHSKASTSQCSPPSLSIQERQGGNTTGQHTSSSASQKLMQKAKGLSYPSILPHTITKVTVMTQHMRMAEVLFLLLRQESQETGSPQRHWEPACPNRGHVLDQGLEPRSPLWPTGIPGHERNCADPSDASTGY